MRISRFSLALLCLASLDAGLLGAANDSVETPAPPAPKGSPFHIEAKPGATLERDFRQRYLAWCQRNLVEPARARLRGTKWEAEAGRFLDAAIQRYVQPDSRDLPYDLMRDGLALDEKGCPDPLVLYLTERFILEVQGREYGQNRARHPLGRADAAMNADPDHAGILGPLILWEEAGNNLDPALRDSLDEKAARWMAAAMTDGQTFAPGEEEIWLRQFSRDGVGEKHLERAGERYAPLAEKTEPPSALPDGARQTLLGMIEIDRAWKDRGGGWASSVTPEGWAGFRQHLKLAHAALTEAWKARPDLPYAATRMIAVVMGGQGEQADDSEFVWFQRAIAGQFDYTPAYRAVLWAMRPRWGGSLPLMYAFGCACMDTGRYDTQVPSFFVAACNDIADDLQGNWKPFLRQPEVARRMVLLHQKLLAEPTRAADRWGDRSLFAVNAWLTGDFAAAQSALAALDPPNLAPCAVDKLRTFDCDEATLRGEAALLSSDQADRFQVAETELAARHYGLARPIFEKILPGAPAAARGFVQAKIDLIALATQLAPGDWCKLPVRPGLADWRIVNGNWSCTEDGVLTSQENTGLPLILYPLHPGPNYDLRAEFAGPPPGHYVAAPCGLVLGYLGHLDRHWLNAAVSIPKEQHFQASLGLAWYSPESGGRKSLPAQEWNLLEAHVAGDRVTFLVNGQTVLENGTVSEGHASGVNGFIGVGASEPIHLMAVRIRGIELRVKP